MRWPLSVIEHISDSYKPFDNLLASGIKVRLVRPHPTRVQRTGGALVAIYTLREPDVANSSHLSEELMELVQAPFAGRSRHQLLRHGPRRIPPGAHAISSRLTR